MSLFYRQFRYSAAADTWTNLFFVFDRRFGCFPEYKSADGK